MYRKSVLLFICVLNLHAAQLYPDIGFKFSFEEFFPSDHEIYDALLFDPDEPEPISDTLIEVRDLLKFMLGYSAELKFRALPLPWPGVNFRLEHLVNRYSNRFYDEYEDRILSYPISVNLFNINYGLYTVIAISDKFMIKPHLNVLHVISSFSHHLESLNDLGTFSYHVTKTGIYSSLDFSYLINKVELGSNLVYVYYSGRQDFNIDPYLFFKFHRYLKAGIGVFYSPLSGSIKPHAGLQLSFPE